MGADHEDLAESINAHIDITTCKRLAYIVRDIIDEHAAIATDFAYEMLPMDMAEPGIGIHQAGDRRQTR
jgi:hypothetical protein